MSSNQLLIIGYVWPEPKSSAAGTRMMELIDLFIKQGFEITFASPAQLSDHMADLACLNVKAVNIELNNESFDAFVADLSPAIVMYDRFMMEEQFGWRVEQQCPNALTILDTEDLHALRHARHQAYKSNRLMTDDDLASDIAQREIAAIYRCDMSLIISSYEMDLLTNHYKVDASILHHLPFMLDIDHLDKPRLPYNERIDFISIGNFRHAPNWDAVLYLKNIIWPLIKKQLPKATLNVYGAYPPPKATQLHNEKQGFLVKGWCDDAHAELGKARICLAPLRFGAGIKGKLADSMLNGTPTVTTTIGSEGMHGTLPWSGIVTNDEHVFAAAAVTLYNDINQWQHCVSHGDDLVKSFYDKEPIGQQLIERINTIITHLKTHRLNNFTGTMLRHHHHKSTKYMAQWIEAKNKN